MINDYNFAEKHLPSYATADTSYIQSFRISLTVLVRAVRQYQWSFTGLSRLFRREECILKLEIGCIIKEAIKEARLFASLKRSLQPILDAFCVEDSSTYTKVLGVDI